MVRKSIYKKTHNPAFLGREMRITDCGKLSADGGNRRFIQPPHTTPVSLL
jgi:hypothetical protein